MGVFLVIVVAILIALWASLVPTTNETSQTAFTANRPAVQAVAANMIEFHRAVVAFVSQGANRNPASTTWSWSFSNQVNVRCVATYTGGLYPAGSSGGSCSAPITEFTPPTYLSNIADWNVYYYSNGSGGSDDIAITYAAASSTVLAGYTSTEVATALADYNLINERTWYWGVTVDPAPAGVPYTLSNGTTTLTLPTGFTALGVVAIATVIP